MAKLSASLLAADFSRLGSDCREVLDAGADMIHFDVMDGHFVNNLSVGLPVLESLRRALPDAYFDVHLMITNPLAYVKAFAEAGANSISFHVEVDNSVSATLASIHAYGCDAGLVLNPNTPAEAVFPYLDGLSLVLVMGVEPGHGGQAFCPAALEKLRRLRTECSLREIDPYLSVDGGINVSSTGPLCVQSGATLLVAGSAVFGVTDKIAAIRALEDCYAFLSAHPIETVRSGPHSAPRQTILTRWCCGFSAPRGI